MTPVEKSVLRVLEQNFPDEGSLLDDPNSFIEMENGVIHIASNKYGNKYFRVVIRPCDESEYLNTPTIWD